MIMIIITIKIMNVEYIWLTLLNAMQIKVSSAVTYDFNETIYAVCAPPRRLRPLPCPTPSHRFLPRSASTHRFMPCPTPYHRFLPRPASPVKKPFPLHPCLQ